MRVVWSLVLVTGLLLIGLQVGESLTDNAAGAGAATEDISPCAMDDGTGFPPPKP